MRTIILLIACLSLVACIRTSTENAEVDALLSNWNAQNTPGAAIGVIYGSQLIHARGYGLADLEHQIPITTNTVFYLGSMGKQFTAFSILLLEESGRLKLEDDIRKYLVDFPDYGDTITIANLLYHTSGIRDYSSLWDLQGEDYFDMATAQETYQLIKSQSALNSRPGEKKVYCNSGYFLLSLIVEKVTGESFKDYVEHNIFKPLRMSNSIVLDDNRDLILNRAFGYYKTDQGFSNAIRRFQLVGSGGVYSTIEDLFKWDQNFYNNKLGLGTNILIDKMYKEGLLNNGDGSGEAGGLVRGVYKGLNTISHGGSHGGFKTELLRFPEHNFSVIVLANRSDASGTGESREIADLYLKEEFRTEPELDSKIKYLETSRIEVNKFVGNYLNLQSGTHRKIVLKEESLYYYRRETSQEKLGPISESEFRMVDRGNPITIKFEEEDTLTMTYFSGDRLVSTMHKIEPLEYSTEELMQFEGQYKCADIDRTYDLRLEGEELQLSLKGEVVSVIKPITRDILSAGSFGTFFFERNDLVIEGFTLNSARVRGLEFLRD